MLIDVSGWWKNELVPSNNLFKGLLRRYIMEHQLWRAIVHVITNS